jgi:hypothetical protein
MSIVLFAPGGYLYAPSVFQYSAGVIAAPGFDIVRVQFRQTARTVLSRLCLYR